MMYENLPKALKKSGHFCLSNKNKVPRAKSNDKSTFCSYDEIIAQKSENDYLAIGLFDTLCCIDLDNCFYEDATFKEYAKDILKLFASYNEKSTSGQGEHIYFYCPSDFSFDIEKYYTHNRHMGIEFYCSNQTNKIMIVTGKGVLYPEIKTVPSETIFYFLNKYMLKSKQYTQEIKKTDKECLAIGLAKDKKLIELLNQIPSGAGGDESETDLKIMCKLAYWTNKNKELMLDAFENSFYYQHKDEEHIKKWKQRVDYRERTIQMALTQVTQIYRDKEQEQIKSYTSIYDDLSRFFSLSRQGAYKPMPTGFSLLDSALEGGFIKQSIVVLGGGSSVGKTTFAINLALKANVPIIYVALEQSKDQIYAKALSCETYHTLHHTTQASHLLKLYDTSATMTQEAQDVLYRTLQTCSSLKNIYVINPTNQTIEGIMDELQNLRSFILEKHQNEPQVVIDYLQFIQTDKREDSANLIKRIQRTLKQYVIDNNTICYLLVANNRESNKEGKKSSLDSGRDTSDIEYSSDYNLQLNFTAYEKESGTLTPSLTQVKAKEEREMTLTIHKSRLGPTGKMVDYIFYTKANTFVEVEEEKKTINSKRI